MPPAIGSGAGLAISLPPDRTIDFHPDHLGRGDKYVSIVYDSLDLATITKDGSERVSEHRNKNSNRTFAATQATDANKPVYVAGEGIRYRTIGGVRQWLDMPNVEVTMDIHYIAVLFKCDPALCAAENCGFTINGTSGSASQRWPFFHIDSNGTTLTPWAGWQTDGAEGGSTTPNFTGTGFHSYVSTVRNGVTYSSLDGGAIVSQGTNIRPFRNTAGTLGIKGSFHVTRDLEYLENYLRIGNAELTDAEIHQLHGWLHWNRLGTGAGLSASAVYKNAAPTISQSLVSAEDARRVSFISTSTEITAVTPDESFSYQQTLAFTGDVPDGFVQTFESIPTAASVTHEANGAGPWYAPGHPAFPNNPALVGSSSAVSWADYNDATAITTSGGKLRLGAYRPTSGNVALKAVSIATMNHEGNAGFWQRHGYWEVRARHATIARTNAEPTIWTSPLWLLSRERQWDRTMLYGEHDFPEVYSKDAAGYHGTAHEHDAPMLGQPGNHPNVDHRLSNYIGAAFTDVAKWNLGSNGFFDGNYHTYGTLLDPDRRLIIAYVDRREVERRPYPSGMLKMEWYGLIWNTFLYANITNEDASSTWLGPYYMDIDYVRCFQKPGWR